MEEFCYITGFKEGSSLLYLKEEKNLFFRKNKELQNGKIHWACNASNIPAIYGQPDSCPARCTMDLIKSEIYRNNAAHIHEANHEIVFRDLESLNAMKNHCRYLAANFPYSAHLIPVKEIFLSEMAKFVYFLIGKCKGFLTIHE